MIVSAARFCIAASRLRLPPTKGFGTARRGGQGRPDLHGDVADCCQLRTAPQRRLMPSARLLVSGSIRLGAGCSCSCYCARSSICRLWPSWAAGSSLACSLGHHDQQRVPLARRLPSWLGSAAASRYILTPPPAVPTT